MDMAIKDKFGLLWRKYFNNAELPVSFYFTDEEGHAEKVKPGSMPRCLIGALSKVRSGRSLCFAADSIGCPGGRRYAGFADKLRPNFEYFLSCGIPGQMQGERYKKSPELVKKLLELSPAFKRRRASLSSRDGTCWSHRMSRRWASSLPGPMSWRVSSPWPILTKPSQTES
jgi:hypothetical protein